MLTVQSVCSNFQLHGSIKFILWISIFLGAIEVSSFVLIYCIKFTSIAEMKTKQAYDEYVTLFSLCS
ncbi:hypothetical protein HanHA300_Chr16g0601491 [Helianthus annuus]|nr:hypothetical protein HanHA300_Chr16g0601491 [Helianthus annuus]KAJ0459697.1 hypothetical protein HanHA89_Chr16g0652001 [Helianthus annuus]